MPSDQQLYRAQMQQLRETDRELAHDLRKAQWGTRRASAKVASQMRRQEAQAGRRLRIA